MPFLECGAMLRLSLHASPRTATLLGLLAACPALWAQTPPLDSLLGGDEVQLQASFPSAQRLGKPRPGPRGLRGQWTVPSAPLAGLPFEATFFFKNKQVQRIEQTWAASGTACEERNSFTPLSQNLQARYGTSPVLAGGNGDSGEQQLSAAWTRDELEVVAHFAKSAARCSLRVVYQARVTKDASEL